MIMNNDETDVGVNDTQKLSPAIQAVVSNLLQLEKQGVIKGDAPLQIHIALDSGPMDAEEVPEDMVGVSDPEEVDAEQNPLLAHVMKAKVVSVKPEARTYSNGSKVTAASQKKPGLPPAKK